ncbi:MAG TPA: YfhO family protein [Acidimicrobiales bacterium]|nr:YfhO family protein [Acidimicrobiales bacterium]
MPDALGLAWTVLAAVAVMAPVLRPGVSLGSFDLLSRIGLTHHVGVAVHSTFPADQILYFVPLTNLAWHQVHSGQLPLWNPYNVLGMPLAFSWQSGVFSVPVLLSYLAPLHLAYTVIVLSKFVIAGAGAYTLCRVLGMGPLSAAFGGTVFELSGPMLHYAGWAMTGVTCWAGWLFAVAVVLMRGRHRMRYTILLALVVAAAVYGGHPESLAVMAVSLVIFLGVSLARRRRTSGGPLRRPIVDVAVAGACGLGLGAPLILPGLQVVQASGRASASGAAAYPLSHLSDVLIGLQGTDFRVPPPYLGVLAVVLAVVALRVFWGRPEILGLGAVAVVGAVLTYKSPLYAVLRAVPVFGRITWNRDVMILALALAVLGAAGIEALLRDEMPATLRKWTLGALGGAGVVVALVTVAVSVGSQRTHGGQGARLAWSAAEVVVGVALLLASGVGKPSAGHAPFGPRRRRLVAGTLLAVQSSVLVALGVSFWSISASYFPPTPGVTALQHAVGSSLVAMGPCRPRPFSPPYSTEVGIRPNANIGYGVHEFSVYEPVLPNTYYASWRAVSGQRLASNLRRVGLFCPQITTAAEARVFGVSYVLTPADGPAPTGAVRDGSVAGEALFHVPGSGQATLLSLPGQGRTLAIDARGTPVPVTHPGAASMRIVTDGAAPQILRLRVTALPGWDASIDGHPVALKRWAKGSMLEARVPAGHHVVELRYWPELFTVGLVVAAAVVVGLVAAAAVVRRRARGGAPGSH